MTEATYELLKILPIILACALLAVSSSSLFLAAWRAARRDAAARAWLRTFAVPAGAAITADEVARRCYMMADAMERARRG